MLKPILLVDDNRDDADLVRLVLRKSKVVNPLLICESGHEALEYCHGIGEGNYVKPVLIILDLKLPDIPGIEVLRSIRVNEHLWDCRVVVLTGMDEYEDTVEARILKVKVIIQKGQQFPLEIHQFFDAGIKLGIWWLLLDERPANEGGDVS